MKKQFLYLAITYLAMVGYVNGQSIDKSLIYKGASSWYSFDSDGADSIGSNVLKPYHVKFESDPVRGNVAVLNHVDTSFFEFTHNPISGEQFTVATWFYYGSTYKEQWQTIFEFVNDVNLNNFYFSPNIGTIGVVSENKTKSKWESVSAATYQTPVDQWLHLAMSFDGGNVIIYANGNVVGSGSTTNTMADLGLTRFFIGADKLRLWRAMDAKFDDFAVWNKVLTQTQIYAIANDTLAEPPKDAPYVFETEDYATNNWNKGTEGDTTYSYYSGTPDTLATADDALLYGVIKGQDQLFVWGRVKTDVKIKIPSWIKIDNDPWKTCDSILPTTHWKWVLLQSLTPSSGSRHILRIAPAISNLKIDKFLVTYNWSYDPNKDFIKKDFITPSMPVSLSISGTTEYTTLLKWHSVPVNDSIAAYDVMNGDNVLASTTDTFASPALQTSTQYIFSIRAKDKAGNVSAKSSTINITTKDLVFTANFSFTNQKIHHFGASDAWSVETLGLWPSAKRDSLAKVLFSEKFDSNGNPEGAGLSNWRFRIGDGSREQSPLGLNPGNWFKTTQCFLNPNGTYNWNKQAGSQWFLKKAKEYGVQHFTAWTDSPPYFMTKSGYVHRITNETSGYNLTPGNYSTYATFLANVANHFEGEGIHFDVISPVNEPQWSWDYAVGQGGQPGTYCSNTELSNLVKSIDTVFKAQSVKSKILITEAGDLSYLYTTKSSSTDNQIYNFWSPSSSLYIGNLVSLSNYVAGHGYDTETTVQNTITSRQNLNSKLILTNPNLQYWQTEYSLLSSGYLEKPNMTPMDYSLFIARIIHYDLTLGNCTGWDWWTTFSRPWSEDHKYRFALINWYPNINDTTCNDGTFEVTKNLWVLSNFSHFIRQGYQRISVLRSDVLTPLQSSDKQLISAYVNPTSDTVVFVVINYADFSQQIKLNLKNLPYKDSIVNFKTYVTSVSDNLKAYPDIDMTNDALSATVKARSVSTFVGSIKKSVLTNIPSTKIINAVKVNISPNPASGIATVEVLNGKGQSVILSDLSGKQIAEYNLLNGKINIDTKGLKPGYYIVSIHLNSGIINKKLMVIR
jgi:O-glycosyl hydrolase